MDPFVWEVLDDGACPLELTDVAKRSADAPRDRTKRYYRAHLGRVYPAEWMESVITSGRSSWDLRMELIGAVPTAGDAIPLGCYLEARYLGALIWARLDAPVPEKFHHTEALEPSPGVVWERARQANQCIATMLVLSRWLPREVCWHVVCRLVLCDLSPAMPGARPV